MWSHRPRSEHYLMFVHLVPDLPYSTGRTLPHNRHHDGSRERLGEPFTTVGRCHDRRAHVGIALPLFHDTGAQRARKASRSPFLTRVMVRAPVIIEEKRFSAPPSSW